VLNNGQTTALGTLAVGLAAASETLHVNGNARVDGNHTVNGNLDVSNTAAAANTYFNIDGYLSTGLFKIHTAGGSSQFLDTSAGIKVGFGTAGVAGVGVTIKGNTSDDSQSALEIYNSSSALIARFSSGGKTNLCAAVGNLGVGMATAPAEQLHVTGNTRVDGLIKLTPITAATASALTPAEGDLVMVSDTDATFTSIGFWGYENGAWAKL